MIRTVLVPLDGSAFGEHALPLALSVARRANAGLRLVHVIQPYRDVVPELVSYQGPIEAELRQEKQKYLDELLRRLREMSSVSLSAEVLDGDIPTMLREAAADGKADLVVMTTHGRGPLARFWLGSVADQLVHELPVPLLLVHPAKESPDFHKEPVFKHILLPLDGTPLAEQIIPPTVDLARAMDADCLLLRVIRTEVPPTLAFQYRGAMVTQRARALIEQMEAIERQQKAEAERYLEGVAERIRSLGVATATEVVLEEHPAAVILHEAADGMDLVALETHGYSGLKRLWVGSVADKVIRGSSVPVLVQRPRQ